MSRDFVHLHLHSEYSLLDGSTRISDLPSRVKELGMNAVALTDHGNMYGAVQFYKACKEVDVKPIFGCEVYVTHYPITKEDKENRRFHLILLAENETGFKNLMKIVSTGYVDGFYYKPRVDYEILRTNHEGIIATSACLGGEINYLLLQGADELAREAAKNYVDIFGKGNFYLELQDHNMREQKEVNTKAIQLARELDIPLICANDAHYLKREDAKTHDVLLCIQTASTLGEENRMKFPTEEFYVKSPEEMEEVFSYIPEAMDNTVEIAKRCNVELEFHNYHLPHFVLPDGYTNVEYLRKLVEEGLEEKYETINDEIRERVEFELETIIQMGYTDYFLIVWDFIRYAKEQDIEVGPGRGSAAGSVVSYALDIIDVDPLEFGLLFERFLNPERVSMPDIDIDFCYERRDEVIDYVVQKYGADHVAQIVTFGTLGARAAIRDVGRVMDIPLNRVDYLAKQVPEELNITLNRALEISPTLKKEYESDDETRVLLDAALSVEGMPRQTSTHAAGVVISKDPITDYVPLTRKGDVVSTQFNMIELEELGLLKMDFLGLRTLTVIRDTLDFIYENHGIKIDFSDIDYNDPKVLSLFSTANTLGVFQFESAGMRNFLKELRPTKFEDLAAANALFRPGPMNQIPKFVESKHDPTKINYPHPALEEILKETYGCIVYQEQVMEIVRKIGGYSLGQADLVRRAMSKKKMAVMEQERQHFIYGELDEKGDVLVPGAMRRGVDEKSADVIYDLMIDFANYAFNKSHSVAYAVVAYRTAYLKTYYPTEFMAAQISSLMDRSGHVRLYIEECKRLGIQVLPPDVNTSNGKFNVEEENIRFGLMSVKNVGSPLVAAIEKAREQEGPFMSLNDFVKRIQKVDGSALNKRAMECLISVGAFDSLGGNRAQYLATYEKLIDSITQDAKRNVEGQFSLFDVSDKREGDDLPRIKDFPLQKKLEMESEILGLYISGHPLDSYKKQMDMYSTMNTLEIQEYKDSEYTTSLTIGGMIKEKRTLVTKKNEIMAFVKLEDLYGTTEVVIFPSLFRTLTHDLLMEGRVILISGNLENSSIRDPQIIAHTIKELEVEEQKLWIKLKDRAHLPEIEGILSAHPGRMKTAVYFTGEGQALLLPEDFWVDCYDESLQTKLSEYVNIEQDVIMK